MTTHYETAPFATGTIAGLRALLADRVAAAARDPQGTEREMLASDCWGHADAARAALWTSSDLRAEARQIARALDDIATSLG